MKTNIIGTDNTSRKGKFLPEIALFIGMLIILLLRSRVSGMPFERDEGEFAYMGQLILKGLMPYTDAYNMKLPGTYLMYALIIKIFGATPAGIHTGVTIVTLLSMYLMYAVIKSIFNAPIAVLTAFVYGLMVSAKSTLGFAGHATHFIVLFLMLGLWCWDHWRQGQKLPWLLLFGACIGFAFLMKQQAIFFILMCGFMVLIEWMSTQEKSFTKVLINAFIYTLGVTLPYILTLVWISAMGDFSKFWFWTVEYARKYTTSVVQWKDAPMMFYLSFKSMWAEFPLVWLTALGGIVTLWLGGYTKHQKQFLTLFFIFSFLTICPGLYFRQHYFITWIPSLALFSSLFFYWLAQKISQNAIIQYIVMVVAGLVILLYAYNHNKSYWATENVKLLSKDIYGTNPFVESREIAAYIKRNSSPSDKIAVLGSEPQIMVYADRISATGHIYTYGMMEKQSYNVKMQEEMIKEIEEDNPKFIVFCKVALSWMEYSDSPRNIFEWMPKYIDKNYEMVGQVEVSNSNTGEFFWDAKALGRQPQSENHIVVFRRKSGI